MLTIFAPFSSCCPQSVFKFHLDWVLLSFNTSYQYLILLDLVLFLLVNEIQQTTTTQKSCVKECTVLLFVLPFIQNTLWDRVCFETQKNVSKPHFKCSVKTFFLHQESENWQNIEKSLTLSLCRTVAEKEHIKSVASSPQMQNRAVQVLRRINGDQTIIMSENPLHNTK